MPPEWSPQPWLWIGFPHLADEWQGFLAAAQARIDKNFRAVQGESCRVVRVEGAGGGDLGPCVLVCPFVPGNHQRAGAADYALVQRGDQLSFGEQVQLVGQLIAPPGGYGGINMGLQLQQGVNVCGRGRTNG